MLVDALSLLIASTSILSLIAENIYYIQMEIRLLDNSKLVGLQLEYC